MQIRQAKRTKAKLKIGLQGPSGSGKTYSALLLAYGITNDWSKVLVIDTENNSADLYAHLGNYKVLPLEPPFTPEKYIEAIAFAEKALLVADVASQNNATIETIATSAEPAVIIIDSISHEWEGQGGILDIHNSMAGNSFTNWGKLTPRHNSFINKILQSKCHVICNIRAKQDYVLSDRNGKMVPEKVGLKGVTREGMDYELTLVFELDIKNHAIATKDRTGLFTGKPEFKINPVIGRMLLTWCETSDDSDDLVKKIESSQSLEELIDIYNRNPTAQQTFKEQFIAKKKALQPKTD